MRRYYWAVIASIGLNHAAAAADMPLKAPPLPPPPAVYDWTGIYIGGNLGGASSHQNFQFVNTVPPGLTPIPPGFAEGSDSASGAIAGGQIGANLQLQHWVVGVEFQGDWTNLSSQHLTPTFQNLLNTNVNSIALLTGRVGYAWDRLLVYGKGGGAWINEQNARGLGVPFGGFPPGTYFAQAQNTASGWTLGAGLEYALSPNWSVGVEYDYLQFGTHTFFYANNAIGNALAFSPFNELVSQNVQMLAVRVNFRLPVASAFGKY